MMSCAFAGTAVIAGEIHVAVNGNNSNTGTASSPFLTLTAARDALRKNKWPGQEPCEVVIHAGTYRLAEPLAFAPSDGGSQKEPVVYRAAGDGKVILTGAQKLTSRWSLWKDGIYRTQVGKREAIDQLFVNGKRQHMARYPNFGAGFLRTKGAAKRSVAGNPPYDGCAPDAWSAEKAAGWKNPEGAFMHGMHRALWGGMHFRVLGKNKNGSLKYEGGWQNNRSSSPHANYRMIENIFEELDAPGEWFHDVQKGWLYYMPAKEVDISSARVESVKQIKHLMEFYGDTEKPIKSLKISKGGNGLKNQVVRTPQTSVPVKHIYIRGLTFRGTCRTFMETLEPILRSDWCLYRGGAIHLRGTEDIVIEGCNFEELGGNAIFVDGDNRRAVIRGNLFTRNGASDVNIVGSPAAVRSPFFSFSAKVNLNQLDTTAGPKTEEYPADCLVEDNLMTQCGRFEKQSSGVNISMSSRITVRHNTISHTPRAAINICNGCWGGHMIEWNDCFETVLETHDHGAFNSWGRDRYWHTAGPAGPLRKDKNGKPVISNWLKRYPNMPRWDAFQTTVLRHNRMHCDHGWDIDLDDGSTNYQIYSNLCLAGGLKTREGYHRTVRNNVIFKLYTCNVPYPKPTFDIFMSNIIWGEGYSLSRPALWGGVRNKTFFHNPAATTTEPAVAAQAQTKDDAGSLYGNARFVDSQNGDFSVASDSPALQVNFKNFPMTGFGVTSPRLKAMASAPPIRLPVKVAPNTVAKGKVVTYRGAKIKSLRTDSELSATGMFERKGVLLVAVPAKSQMAAFGFKADDVVLEINGHPISTDQHLVRIFKRLTPGKHTVKVRRSQDFFNLTFTIKP